jgi:hypothetical protein
MVNPSAHSQHTMHVLNQLVCILSGCGKHSMCGSGASTNESFDIICNVKVATQASSQLLNSGPTSVVEKAW